MKRTSWIRSRAAELVALVLLAVGVSGCAWSIGSDKKGETVVQPTRGQELIDLQRAYEQGILNADEYEQQKRRVLER